MNTFLLEVALVDAKRIDPKMPWFVFIPNLTQSLNEICCHINLKTLAGNRDDILCADPGVRYCFVFLKPTFTSVSIIMSILVCKNINPVPAD